jgi:hypothetical protein
MDVLTEAASLGAMLVQDLVDRSLSVEQAREVSDDQRQDIYIRFQRSTTRAVAEALSLQVLAETAVVPTHVRIAPIAGLSAYAEMRRLSERLTQHALVMSGAMAAYGLANLIDDVVGRREVRQRVWEAHSRIAELLDAHADVRLVARPTVQQAANLVVERISDLLGSLPGAEPDAWAVILPGGSARRRSWNEKRTTFDERVKVFGEANKAFASAISDDLRPKHPWWMFWRWGRRGRQSAR